MKHIALALPILAIGALGFSGAAAAAPGVVIGGPSPTSTVPTAAVKSPTATPPSRGGSKAPKGYTVVSNGVVSPAGSQTWGLAECPSGKVVLGGGVYATTSATDVSVSSSFPGDESEWFVHENNGSGSAVDLVVFAVCADTPGKYSIQSTTVTSPPDQQSTAYASCPAKTELLGGGGGWSLGAPVTIDSTLPVGTSWRVDVNNNGSAGAGGVVYAICGKEKAVSGVQGPETDNPAGAQTSETVTCPGTTVPFSGGVLADVSALTVNLNSTFPQGQDWTSFENNAGAGDDETYAEVICGS